MFGIIGFYRISKSFFSSFGVFEYRLVFVVELFE